MAETMATTQGPSMSTLAESDLDMRTVTKAYARWAPVYDLVFGQVFERGRLAAIAAAERVGGRILEVGVGTGISLPHYSKALQICGVDISEPMLRKARERVKEFGLANVEGLWVMDAESLHISRCLIRYCGGTTRRFYCPKSGSSTRRICPRPQAGW